MASARAVSLAAAASLLVACGDETTAPSASGSSASAGPASGSDATSSSGAASSTGASVGGGGAGGLGNCGPSSGTGGAGPTWSRCFGGPGDDAVYAVAADATGVTAMGYFQGSVDFGGGPLEPVGEGDCFLVRLDADGQHVFSLRYGGGTTTEICGTLAPAGPDVLVAGSCGIEGFPVDFLGKQCAPGAEFVARVDGAGKLVQWMETPVLGLTWRVQRVASGPGTGVFVLAEDSFASKVSLFMLDNVGSVPWKNDYLQGSPPMGVWGMVGTAAGAVGIADLGGNDLWAVDASGGFLWTGKLDLSGSKELAQSSGGDFLAVSSDYVVRRYDGADGALAWEQDFGAPGDTGFLGVAGHASGAAVLTGRAESSIDFGGPVLVPPDGRALFVATLSLAGEHVASQLFVDSGTTVPTAISAVDDSSSIVVGWFDGSLDFGQGALVASGKDAFIARVPY